MREGGREDKGGKLIDAEGVKERGEVCEGEVVRFSNREVGEMRGKIFQRYVKSIAKGEGSERRGEERSYWVIEIIANFE